MERHVKIMPDVQMRIENPMVDRFTTPRRIADYFYEITYSDYDFTACNNFLLSDEVNISLGGCSEIHKNNLIGRNYDWTYSHMASFKLNTLAKEGERFASTATANISPITDIIGKKCDWSKWYKLLPSCCIDGVNENGVYIGVNVAPEEDTVRTSNSNPGKPVLSVLMMPRLVLDKATTAKDIVSVIKNDYSWTSPARSGKNEELHILICDKDNDYIIEFRDNNMVILSNTDSEYNDMPNGKTIMTNFFNSDWTGTIAAGFRGNTAVEIRRTGLTRHADGLERYEILANNYDSIGDAEQLLSLMQQIWYTKAVNTTNPWYSELVAGSLDIYGSLLTFDAAMVAWRQEMSQRSRDLANTWQTIHTAVYDLDNKKVYYRVQEDFPTYEFDLPIKGD